MKGVNHEPTLAEVSWLVTEAKPVAVGVVAEGELAVEEEDRLEVLIVIGV